LLDSIGRYFYETTQKLIAEHSFTLVGGKTFGIDLVKHVLRTVPVFWAASDLVSGEPFEVYVEIILMVLLIS
jgi:hypothetical protein